jgi:flagellar biosynthetic protein FlhB
MAEERTSAQERTEKATPQQRQRAREEGRVPRSPELSSAFVLLGGTLAIALVGGGAIASHLRELMIEATRLVSQHSITPSAAIGIVKNVASTTLMALVPFTLVVLSTVFVVNLIQARGVVSVKPVSPKLSNLSPISGIKRIVGLDSIANLVKSTFKIIALGLITYLVLSNSWPELVSLGETGASEAVSVLKSLAFKLAATTGLAFLILAAADYGYQVYKLEKSLRMTKQEVIREHRETEGDPLVKSRIRSIAMSMARKRMLQEVPTADVVVVNPTHVAVALRYDLSVALAPVVVAMGQRKLAARIRQIALESRVPVIEDKPVARALLATAKVGQPIPPALYAVIAEILAFVYRQRANLPVGDLLAGKEIN